MSHSIKHPALPSTGALLGIDPGEKRVGLAVCDPTQMVARPLETQSRQWKKLRATLAALIAEHQVAGIIIGLALREDGSKGKQAQRSETLAFHLRQEWPELPIAMSDERWSSTQADRALANVDRTERDRGRDAAAAAVILQAYLDSRPRQ